MSKDDVNAWGDDLEGYEDPFDNVSLIDLFHDSKSFGSGEDILLKHIRDTLFPLMRSLPARDMIELKVGGTSDLIVRCCDRLHAMGKIEWDSRDDSEKK